MVRHYDIIFMKIEQFSIHYKNFQNKNKMHATYYYSGRVTWKLQVIFCHKIKLKIK